MSINLHLRFLNFNQALFKTFLFFTFHFSRFLL